MNEAISRTAADWILSLNADARPDPEYVDRLLACSCCGAWRAASEPAR